MSKIKVIFAGLALLFGFFVFSTSVLLASQNEMHDTTNASERTFYAGTILPDHVFYPLIMIRDKFFLTLAQDAKKIKMRINFSEDRFQRAELLLEKGQEQLALTTLTKSQKYVIFAAQEYLDYHNSLTEEQQQALSQQLGSDVLIALKQSTFKLDGLQSKFKSVDTQPLEVLVDESNTLISLLLITI